MFIGPLAVRRLSGTETGQAKSRYGGLARIGCQLIGELVGHLAAFSRKTLKGCIERPVERTLQSWKDLLKRQLSRDRRILVERHNAAPTPCFGRVVEKVRLLFRQSLGLT